MTQSSEIDESGEFKFSDSSDPNQIILFEKAPYRCRERVPCRASRMRAVPAARALSR
jgi:hypothetical protein